MSIQDCKKNDIPGSKNIAVGAGKHMIYLGWRNVGMDNINSYLFKAN